MIKIAVVPGDGIGKEVIPEAIRVLEATDLRFDFNFHEAGYELYKATGDNLPRTTLEAIKSSPLCLFGATTTPVGVPGYSSVIISLRKALGVYANLRPAKSVSHSSSRKNVDLIVVRENTEDLYSGIEYGNSDTAITLRVITRAASERIAKYAYSLAERRRKKLCIVTKANVLRRTCGLFRDACLRVSEDYPDVNTYETYVDVASMNLVIKPETFDVILTTNLFGDILSDEAAGLTGGIGLAPSTCIGDGYALFEPIHGSAPDIAGKGIANPMAAILSAKMMLEHIDENAWAKRIEDAVMAVIKNGSTLTPDLGGSAITSQVTDAVINALA